MNEWQPLYVGDFNLSFSVTWTPTLFATCTPDTHRGGVLYFCGSVLVIGTALVSFLLAIRRKGWTRPWRLRTPEGAKRWTFSSSSQASVSRLRVDTRRHCMVCSIRTRQKGSKVAHGIASWREKGASRVECWRLGRGPQRKERFSWERTMLEKVIH